MTKGDGLPCIRCGTSDWYKNGSCKQCAKVNCREWRRANPEKVAAMNRSWREANPDQYREIYRNYWQANPDKKREKDRRWRRANPDKRAETERRWRRANPEKTSEHRRRWKKANPDSVKAHKHLRRARLAGSGGSYSSFEWEELCRQYDYRCVCCGKRKKLTVDHVVPISKGGSSDISNIQPLCKRCNFSKGTKIVDYRAKPSLLRWIQRKLF